MTDTPPSRSGRDAPAAERTGAQARRRSKWWLWLVLIVILLAAWYWFSQRETEPAPAPPVDITSPAEQAADADRVSRPERATRPEARPEPAVPAFSPATPLADQNPAPSYPPEALRVGEGGTVVLSVEVGADGRPGNIEFARRSGSRELDRAAREAVAKWRFEPAMRDGEAVASTVEVPVEFSPEPQ